MWGEGQGFDISDCCVDENQKVLGCQGGIRWLECRQFHSTRLEMKKDFYFEPVVGEFFKYTEASIWKWRPIDHSNQKGPLAEKEPIGIDPNR